MSPPPAGLQARLAAAMSNGTLDLAAAQLEEVPPEVRAVLRGDAIPEPTKARAMQSWDDAAASPQWWATSAVLHIKLNDNNLESLPDEAFGEFVESVVASKNALTAVPTVLADAPHIRLLDVAHNAIDRLPPLPPTLASLKAHHNRIVELPHASAVPSALAEIDASHNPSLARVPPEFGSHFCNLVRIAFKECALEALPEGLFESTARLEDLDVSGNRLVCLPRSLGEASQLRSLIASRNRLTSIHRLPTKRLAELIVADNRPLTDLPPSVAECAALATVIASGCGFSHVPTSLLDPAGPPIATLDISSNDIRVVPPEIAHRAKTLRALRLEGNPIKSVRQSLLNGPTSKLMAHLRAMLPEDPEADTAPAFGTAGARAGTTLDISAADASWMQNAAARGAFSGINTLVANGASQLIELPILAIPAETKLAAIRVTKSRLAVWPEPLPPSLEELSLEECDLAGPAPPLGRIAAETCGSLRILRLNHCGKNVRWDASAETALAHFNNLEEVALQGLGLRHLPVVALSACTARLRVLDVSNNAIADVTPGVVRFTALEILNVSNNDIGDLPPELGTMGPEGGCGRLGTLVLDGNPLRRIRRGVLDRGTTGVLAYLRDRLTA